MPGRKNTQGMSRAEARPLEIAHPSSDRRRIESASKSVEVAHTIPIGFQHLANATERALKAIEANQLRMSRDLVSFQLRALKSIHEAAAMSLEMGEAIRATARPSRRMPLPVREPVDAMEAMAFDFARAAVRLMGALANPDAPPTRAAGETPTLDFARRVATLTRQQRKVLRELERGSPNKLIAHALGISETTVKAHVSQILVKLGVPSRARAIALISQRDETELRMLGLRSEGEGS